MPLNHLNLPVRDVSAATAFFETYFSFTCTETKGDNIIAVLKDAHNFTLVLMKQKAGAPAYPRCLPPRFYAGGRAGSP